MRGRAIDSNEADRRLAPHPDLAPQAGRGALRVVFYAAFSSSSVPAAVLEIGMW